MQYSTYRPLPLSSEYYAHVSKALWTLLVYSLLCHLQHHQINTESNTKMNLQECILTTDTEDI